jgi:hypothetical protein
LNALAEAPTGAQEGEQQHQEETLFPLPPIVIDGTKPTALHIAISGSIALDISQKADVDFWNELQAGKLVTREVTFFVKGAKTVHRRDNDDNVDAIVSTKSLVVDGVTIAEAE